MQINNCQAILCTHLNYDLTIRAILILFLDNKNIVFITEKERTLGKNKVIAEEMLTEISGKHMG